MALEQVGRGEVAGRTWKGLLSRTARGVRTFAARKPLGAVGGGIIIVMVCVAVAAPLIAGDPLKWVIADKLQGPSLTYLLGTDDLGRDLWSRIVYGARISLYVGLLSVFFGNMGGAILGLVGCYYGGKLDTVVQRIMDTLMSIPSLIMALTIMAALGTSLNNVVLAISITMVPRASRIVRSAALAVKESEYVMAARSIGATDVRIMLQHVMPQCIAPWLIIATAGLGGAILTESSLSFLGMGVPPPAPTWGGMLSGRGRDYWQVAPWMAIVPGAAISLAVYGFNLFGDSIRDVLDPRLRGT